MAGLSAGVPLREDDLRRPTFVAGSGVRVSRSLCAAHALGIDALQWSDACHLACSDALKIQWLSLLVFVGIEEAGIAI
jgi:hypothetical protein